MTMTAQKAWANGMAWATVKISSGRHTPLFKGLTLEAKGPVLPQVGFLIGKLMEGLTVAEARTALDNLLAKQATEKAEREAAISKPVRKRVYQKDLRTKTQKKKVRKKARRKKAR